MLYPSCSCPARRNLRGPRLRRAVCWRGQARILARRFFTLPRITRSIPAALPAWVVWGPLTVTAIGLFGAWYAYIRHEGMGARIAARKGPLWSFLYNKWYFDELYDAIFVRSRQGAGRSVLEGRRQAVIDGLGPDGVSRGRPMPLARLTGRAQTGYVYHYAFVMLLGIAGLLVYASLGLLLMVGILSLITFPAAFRRRRDPAPARLRRRRPGARQTRSAGSRLPPPLPPWRSRSCGRDVRSSRAASNSSRISTGFPASLPDGRRRHIGAVRPADRVPDADLHPGQLEVDHPEGGRIHDRLPDPRTLVIGVFCALDLILFYLFFEFQLLPMFLIIGIWGGKNRLYAAFKFFLYTLLGSVLMLAAILAMV